MWPTWEARLNRNAQIWASVLHFSITVYLGFWLEYLAEFITPTPKPHPKDCTLTALSYHQVLQVIRVVIFNGKGSRRGDTDQRGSMLQRDPWDSFALHRPRVCMASRALLSHKDSPHLGCGLGRPEPPTGKKWVPLPLTDASCLAIGMLLVREKRGTVITWWILCLHIASPWVSLFLSVSFNPPGAQGFPRDTGFPSQRKGKCPLQAAHNITQLLVLDLSK